MSAVNHTKIARVFRKAVHICGQTQRDLVTDIYAVQQDTQSVLMSEFYSALTLARHVSDLIGPSLEAFCTSCGNTRTTRQVPSSRYEVV